ncbi:predicted protein [Postia placenta Mad-698-R]|nr:predicted protein [Postia placenta Mad-698-R]
MSTNTSRSPATELWRLTVVRFDSEPIAGPSTTPTSSSPRPSAAGESGKSHASPSRVAGASNTPTRSNATFPHHITGTFNVPNATESDDVFDEVRIPSRLRRGTPHSHAESSTASTSTHRVVSHDGHGRARAPGPAPAPIPRMKFQWYYRKDTVGRHAEKCKGAKEGSQSTIFGQPLPRPGSVATPATPEPSSSAGVSSERPPSAGPLTVSTVSSPLPSQSVTDAEQGTSDSLRIIATSPRLTGIPAVAESAEVIIEASVTTSAMSTPSTPSPGRQSAGPQQRVSPQHSPRLPAVDMLGTASPSPGTVNIADDRTLLEADTQASTAVEVPLHHDTSCTADDETIPAEEDLFAAWLDITEWMITEGIASHYHRIYERHKRMPDVPGGSLEQGPSPAFDKELVVLCHLGALSSTRIHEADTCRLINIDRLIVVIYHFYLKWWLDVCMELIVIMYTNVAIPPTEM